MPYFKLSEVAQRLNANESWLQDCINADRRSGAARLQFHHYIGRSPIWTLDACESLRRSLASELADRRQRLRRTPGARDDGPPGPGNLRRARPSEARTTTIQRARR